MNFLRYLLIFLICVYVLRLIIRVYGPYVLRFLISRALKKMQEEQLRTANNAHSKSINSEKEFYIRPGLLIKVMKNEIKPPPKNIQDIEFEEIIEK